MAERIAPDMTGKASEITDLMQLYARIGYRVYLTWRDGDRAPAELYHGYNTAELKRLRELRGDREPTYQRLTRLQLRTGVGTGGPGYLRLIVVRHRPPQRVMHSRTAGLDPTLTRSPAESRPQPGSTWQEPVRG